MIEGHGDDTYNYGYIRSDFSSNICAHGSHEALMAHLAAHPELIGHYPEPEAWSLEKRLAERLDLTPEQVIVTSGATEAIYLVAQAFRGKHTIPAPTFSEYGDACRLFERREERSVLWLCNPNNPTGEVRDAEEIMSLTEGYDLLVLDQSYEQYTARPLLAPSEATRSPRIIQIHSMTKTYGVPGLRLGFITAHSRLTAILRRYLHPWSVSALAVEAGHFLLQHDELRCRPDLQEAQRLLRRLSALLEVSVGPTETNFILCRLAHHTAAQLKAYLAQEHHILIRDASNFQSLTPQHFRVAAQTPAENDALVATIERFLKTAPCPSTY